MDLPKGRYAATVSLHRASGDLIGNREATAQTRFSVYPQAHKQAIPSSASGPVRKNTMHIVAMSARVYDRYEECFVMLKSMLFHWGRTRHAKGLGMTLHLIVDEGGFAYFNEKLSDLRTLPGELLSIQFHDYHTTCVQPLESFLHRFQLPMSPHYSGAAGYCRLFMMPMLQKLGVEAFVAIESDQLFFQDVELLWRHLESMPAEAFVAAPEMYQPWQDGRPHDDDAGEPEDKGIKDVDAEYHGNGYIGGIMLFNVTRMMAVQWEERWPQELEAYIQSQSTAWVPKLNDQVSMGLYLERRFSFPATV